MSGRGPRGDARHVGAQGGRGLQERQAARQTPDLPVQQGHGVSWGIASVYFNVLYMSGLLISTGRPAGQLFYQFWPAKIGQN